MSNLFSKLRDFVGLNDPADYEYEYDEVEGEEYQSLYQEENQQPQPMAQPMPQSTPQSTPQAVASDDARGRRRPVRERMVSSDPGMTSMNNVIGMPGAINGMSEVMVMEPRSFEEMPQAIQALRERKSVVLNLTVMDPDQAQRAVDFVAGGTYAMDGHQERIGESIFLFTPNCVQVSTQTDIDEDLSAPQPQTIPTPAPRQAPPTPAWAEQQVRMA